MAIRVSIEAERTREGHADAVTALSLALSATKELRGAAQRRSL